MLIKTLRTTLAAHDPSCAVQVPAWALRKLAALVVLLGPALVTNVKLTNGGQGTPYPLRASQNVVGARACVRTLASAGMSVLPATPHPYEL